MWVDEVGMAVSAFGGRSTFLLVGRMGEMEGVEGMSLLPVIPTGLT